MAAEVMNLSGMMAETEQPVSQECFSIRPFIARYGAENAELSRWRLEATQQ